MPICPICDDSGLQNSDPAHPQFCLCAAGKQARREWEAAHAGQQAHAQSGQAAQESRREPASKQSSFIDIERLEEVNASVDAMRAALIGNVATETGARVKPSAVQLLYQVAHAGHEVSIAEATQLYELAKALEGFLTALAPIGRKLR